jgi:hypothetical protein
VTVAHLPPGTSKWNKIEHRLFAFITMNPSFRLAVTTNWRNSGENCPEPSKNVAM